MKLLIIVFLIIATNANAQTQEQINKIKMADDYIDAIIKKAGNKRIIALGEDTHGTAEFYELRTAITKRLITEKGFTTLILENPYEDMQALQDGLYANPLDTLMRKHLFSIYQSTQMKDFLQWFKTYAATHKKLKLAGCDDSYRELLPAMMLKEVRGLKSATLSGQAKEFQQRQLKDAEDDMEYGLGTYMLLQQMDNVYNKQKRRNKKFEELVFHAKTAYIFYYRFSRKEVVSRDEIMGERINYYAKDPSQKIIVWAHSGHIAKYAWYQKELGLMGATVLKQFPNDYLAISMTTGNGTYSYINNRFINGDHVFDDTLHTGTFREARDSSWNKVFIENTSEKFVLDFSGLSPADSASFIATKKLRVQGYRKEGQTYSEFYSVSLARMFDMILFLRNTRATDGLFK